MGSTPECHERDWPSLWTAWTLGPPWHYGRPDGSSYEAVRDWLFRGLVPEIPRQHLPAELHPALDALLEEVARRVHRLVVEELELPAKGVTAAIEDALRARDGKLVGTSLERRRLGAKKWRGRREQQRAQGLGDADGSVPTDQKLGRLIRRHGTDEDGAARSDRNLQEVLRANGARVSLRRIAKFRRS